MTNTFVFDTNCLVSASHFPKSLLRQAFDKAVRLGSIASSQQVFEEYIQVLFRRKFDKYFISNEERLVIAVAANASCIITGDKDLLVLHPFRGIAILNAADFLNMF